MSGRPKLQDLITPDMSDEESAAVARAVFQLMSERLEAIYGPPPTREEVAAEIRKKHRAAAIRCARMFNDGRSWVRVDVYGPVSMVVAETGPLEPESFLICDFPIGPQVRRDPRKAKRIWNDNLDSMTEFELQHHTRWRMTRT